MKILLLLLLILFTVPIYSQSKYLIYFKDKGISKNTVLKKSDALYKTAESLLSEKALERRRKVMGENIISYDDLPVKEEYLKELKTAGIEIDNVLTWFNAVSAYLTPEQIIILKHLPFINKIDKIKVQKFKREIPPEDNLRKQLLRGNDIIYGNSFGHLTLSDIPVVHSRGITGEGVLIGLLDTGFDWRDHEALINTSILAEYDFVFNDSVTANQTGDLTSQHNHGTSVLSIVGGFKDSVLAGASFNSEFILSKTEDVRSETRVEEDNYAAALIWMESLGADITSSSLGYRVFPDDPEHSYSYNEMDGNTTIVTKACEMAFSRGVLTITSAGNDGPGTGTLGAPSDGFNTIAVGAVDPDNTVTSFSSRGPTADGRIKPDITTQGTSVFAATPAGFSTYTLNFSGTSAAAPIACGVAGLLLSAHPHLTNIQLRDILLKTADNSANPDNNSGYGLLSAADAVNFPNVEKTGNDYKLHKIFVKHPAIEPASVKIFYSPDTSLFTEASLLFDGNIRFNFTFPSLNDEVFFYFTFQDNTGSFREPLNGFYRYDTGQAVDVINEGIPEFYSLEQNYPNPFNPVTSIEFRIPVESFVTLKVFDILGREIKTLLQEQKAADDYNITFNAAELASGVYIYRLQAGDFVISRKMMLLK